MSKLILTDCKNYDVNPYLQCAIDPYLNCNVCNFYIQQESQYSVIEKQIGKHFNNSLGFYLVNENKELVLFSNNLLPDIKNNQNHLKDNIIDVNNITVKDFKTTYNNHVFALYYLSGKLKFIDFFKIMFVNNYFNYADTFIDDIIIKFSC